MPVCMKCLKVYKLGSSCECEKESKNKRTSCFNCFGQGRVLGTDHDGNKIWVICFKCNGKGETCLGCINGFGSHDEDCPWNVPYDGSGEWQ